MPVLVTEPSITIASEFWLALLARSVTWPPETRASPPSEPRSMRKPLPLSAVLPLIATLALPATTVPSRSVTPIEVVGSLPASC